VLIRAPSGRWLAAEDGHANAFWRSATRFVFAGRRCS
jgi:hypothetical protein